MAQFNGSIGSEPFTHSGWACACCSPVHHCHPGTACGATFDTYVDMPRLFSPSSYTQEGPEPQ